MVLEVTSEVMAAMAAAARAAHPDEACGILTGEEGADAVQISGFCPARNVHPAPASHFEIDPQALIDAHRSARGGGPAILGYFHSHPNGRAEPSPTDRAEAPHDDRIWAIAAGDTLTFWRDTSSGFHALSYSVIAR